MKHREKLIHEGNYVVAVGVQLVEPAPGWEPCLTLLDAEKLDEARAALRNGDLNKAALFGAVYRLTPLTV